MRIQVESLDKAVFRFHDNTSIEFTKGVIYEVEKEFGDKLVKNGFAKMVSQYQNKMLCPNCDNKKKKYTKKRREKNH